jgi:hypothetical protein
VALACQGVPEFRPRISTVGSSLAEPVSQEARVGGSAPLDAG